MKKLISLALCIVMALSLAIPAFAAEDTGAAIDEADLEYVVCEIVAELVDADEDAEIIIESTESLTEAFDGDGDGEVTADELTIDFSQYLFISADEVEAISDEIVENAKFSVHVLKDGSETVYIGLDLVKYPQLFNLDVIRQTVKKLMVKQDEFYAENGSKDAEANLLSYQHMAGEIAAHIVGYVVFDMLGGENPDSEYHKKFNQVKYIELTINEDRFPVSLINFMGKIIMDFISVTFFDVFNAM